MKTILKFLLLLALVSSSARAEFLSYSNTGPAFPIVVAAGIIPQAYLLANQDGTNIQFQVLSMFDLLNAQSGLLDDNNIAATIARDSEVTAAIAALSSVYNPLLGFTPLTAAQTTNAATQAALNATNALGSAAYLTTVQVTNAATQAAFNATNVLGTAAYSAVGAFQPANANLTNLASVANAAFGRNLATNTSASIFRSVIGVAIGTDVLAPSGSGAALTVDASGFNGNLTTSDNTVQEIAQKLDDLTVGSSDYGTNGFSGTGTDLVRSTNAALHNPTITGTMTVSRLDAAEFNPTNMFTGRTNKLMATDANGKLCEVTNFSGITWTPETGTLASESYEVWSAGYYRATVAASISYALPPFYHGVQFATTVSYTNIGAMIFNVPYDCLVTNLYVSHNNYSGTSMTGTNYVVTCMTNGVIATQANTLITAKGNGAVAFAYATNNSFGIELNAGSTFCFLLINTNAGSPTEQNLSISVNAVRR